MKVLLINGSPNREGCTYVALKQIQETFSKEISILKSIAQVIKILEDALTAENAVNLENVFLMMK